MSRDCCVARPRAAMGLSAVCDCGISSLTIYDVVQDNVKRRFHFAIRSVLDQYGIIIRAS